MPRNVPTRLFLRACVTARGTDSKEVVHAGVVELFAYIATENFVRTIVTESLRGTEAIAYDTQVRK